MKKTFKKIRRNSQKIGENRKQMKKIRKTSQKMRKL